jgi:hypothetical protein
MFYNHLNLMNSKKSEIIIFCHSSERGSVSIGNITQISLFVIPGLTRNPLPFQRSTLLDAGSSPA